MHYFAHATVGPFRLVNVLARKVGQAPRRSRAETALAVSQVLLDDERKHLLVLDEAHVMPDDTLEDGRLLTIADFDRKSPFGLILAGHPVLDDRLAEPTHHALDQRITTVARLARLSLDETRDYIRLRLDASGARGQAVFDDDAIAALFDVGAGVPRRLNRAASSAMIVAGLAQEELSRRSGRPRRSRRPGPSVMRSHVHRDLLDELPPWPRPFVADLRCAPELAVLAVVHTAVRAALVALAAEHPTLADLGPPDEPPTIRHARELVETCLALGAALDSHRRAAIAAFRSCRPCDHDLPF